MSWFNSAFSGLTDWLGITDTKANDRGLKELKSQASSATDTLNQQMAPVMQMYQEAMNGRSMNDVLDQYDSAMANEKDAGSESNVQDYLNPNYNRALSNAANQALGGAGSSLQSSAGANAVANAVANSSTSMWNTAFSQALQDSANNQTIANNVLSADMNPSQSWGQLTSDLANTQYSQNMDLATAAGQTAGQTKSWLGNIF